MVHVPLFVSDKFKGKSGAGLFGDVVMEVDWSVGQVLAKLKELELDERTLVVFTSDNGPWLNYGDHAGSAGSLREGKGTMFEGGCREPTIMRWPGSHSGGDDLRRIRVDDRRAAHRGGDHRREAPESPDRRERHPAADAREERGSVTA